MTTPQLELALDRVHEWVRNADQKVSIFLAVQGILLTIVLSDSFSWVRDHWIELPNWSQLLLAAAVVLFILSIYRSVSTLLPKMRNTSPHKSMTFFVDIASMSLEEYSQVVQEDKDEDYRSDLVQQIHTSAVIARRKHVNVAQAISLFFLGVVVLISFLLTRGA